MSSDRFLYRVVDMMDTPSTLEPFSKWATRKTPPTQSQTFHNTEEKSWSAPCIDLTCNDIAVIVLPRFLQRCKWVSKLVEIDLSHED